MAPPTPSARLLPFPDRESWRYTPLARLEKLQGSPSGPAALATSSLPNGVSLRLLAWGELREGFPGSHPICARPEEGTAWELTVEDGIDATAAASDPVTLTLTGQAGCVHTAGLRIRLGRGSTLTLQQHDGAGGMSNLLMIVELADGARLDHARLPAPQGTSRDGALSLLQARVAADAVYRHTSLMHGLPFSRQEDHFHLIAPGATIRTTSVALLTGTEHGDFTTRIHHDAAGTTSSQSARTVLDAEATGVFQGLIRVAPDAQKTEGHQMSRALLLSPLATMNAKPELEILADDVACSHGSTTGALDPDALFYLRARGLNEEVARRLLVQGFVLDLLQEGVAPSLIPALESSALAWLERLA